MKQSHVMTSVIAILPSCVAPEAIPFFGEIASRHGLKSSRPKAKSLAMTIFYWVAGSGKDGQPIVSTIGRAFAP